MKQPDHRSLLSDEKKETAAGFWQRAHAYFAPVGVTVERVLTDNKGLGTVLRPSLHL